MTYIKLNIGRIIRRVEQRMKSHPVCFIKLFMRMTNIELNKNTKQKDYCVGNMYGGWLAPFVVCSLAGSIIIFHLATIGDSTCYFYYSRFVHLWVDKYYFNQPAELSNFWVCYFPYAACHPRHIGTISTLLF